MSHESYLNNVPHTGPSRTAGPGSGRQRRHGHSGPPTGDFQLHSASDDDDDDSDTELQRASQRSRRRRIGGRYGNIVLMQ